MKTNALSPIVTSKKLEKTKTTPKSEKKSITSKTSPTSATLNKSLDKTVLNTLNVMHNQAIKASCLGLHLLKALKKAIFSQDFKL